MGEGSEPFWYEEPTTFYVPGRVKRKSKNKKEFLGWGSRPLIEFLQSIGKDTSRVLSQDDVTLIINQYINENRLINPQKKKRVICDEKLHALFGRKSVGRIKIHNLLEAHFAENQEESEDDLIYSSEEKEDETWTNGRNQKSLFAKAQHKRRAVEVPNNSPAAINSENLKLVYLKRSLVQDLLKDSSTFKSKVVGSFVRIKTDPHDYLARTSHQLRLVTGVNRTSSDRDNCSEVRLQVSNPTDDISIFALSDDDFSAEECEDLRQKVKDGLLNHPTVAELEQKARVLHEDITKHWLVRELALLRNRIDRANEKGWRSQVTEYLDRKKLLETPSEQARLLSEVPKVIPEVLKPDTSPEKEDSSHKVEEANDEPARSVDWDWEPSYDPPAKGVAETQFAIDLNVQVEVEGESNGHLESTTPKPINSDTPEQIETENNGHREIPSPKASDPRTPEERESEKNGHLEIPTLKERDSPKANELQLNQPIIIDLSDDDNEEDEVPKRGIQTPPDPLPEELAWHYLDPQGNIQGPFSMSSLKRWNDAGYFPPEFVVWRMGRSLNEAVLLKDALGRMFLR